MAVQMNVGLEKLREASISVDELRKDLAEKEKDIIIASAKAEEVPLFLVIYLTIIYEYN